MSDASLDAVFDKVADSFGTARKWTIGPNLSLRDRAPHTMKMLAEYLEKVITFEKMAGEQKDAKLKANIEYLAVAYRKLADERATKLGLLPSPPK